jgi:hypothetical protein
VAAPALPGGERLPATGFFTGLRAAAALLVPRFFRAGAALLVVALALALALAAVPAFFEVLGFVAAITLFL